ncbi:hypothetical protein BJX64DRAFT_266613 [Aspergillus heterothallicus]
MCLDLQIPSDLRITREKQPNIVFAHPSHHAQSIAQDNSKPKPYPKENQNLHSDRLFSP